MDGVILISSKVGVSIFTREFSPNYGLPIEQQQSDISLSGLIFALKLNADFAVSHSDSSKPSLTYFSFNGSSIHFYQHPTMDALCAVFTRYNDVPEFSIGEYFAKEICTRFCEKYPKVIASSKYTRRKFNSFNDDITAIWKEATVKLLSCIQSKLLHLFTTHWIYLCSSPDFSNMLNRISPILLISNQHKKQPASTVTSKVIPLSEFSENDTMSPRDSTLKDLNATATDMTPQTPLPETERVTQVVKTSKLKTFWKALFNRDKNQVKIKFVEDVMGDVQIYVQDEFVKDKRTIAELDSALASFFCAGQLMSGVEEIVEYMELNMTSQNEEIKFVFFKEGSMCAIFPVLTKDVSQQMIMYHLVPLLRPMEKLLQNITSIAKNNHLLLDVNNVI
jgi:hypothetical protein